MCVNININDTGLYMESDTLGNFARNTASSLARRGWISGKAVAGDGLKIIRSLRRKAADPDISAGAAEWLSDNFYIAERETRDAAESFSAVKKLSRTSGGHAAISEIANAIVRSGRGEVTEERIELFLTEFQLCAPLEEKELSLLVPALKMELTAFIESVVRKHINPDELPELLKAAFTSLRFLSTADLSELLERQSVTEQLLSKDPAGIYTRMDDETRRYYRRSLSKAAAKHGISEHEAARTVLRLAKEGDIKHVGYYILVKPLGEAARKPTGTLYIAANALFTLALDICAGTLLRSFAIAALLLVPLSELAKNIIDFVCLKITPPARLPRMDLKDGVPDRGRTICVISALLTSEEDGSKYASLLEEYALLSRGCGKNLLFGILADFAGNASPRAREDADIAENAKDAIEELNRKYGGGFYLLLRDREWNDSDGIYMGRERKRGAITELVRLLSGDASAVNVMAGDGRKLKNVNFILTLDSDTRLTAESAEKLIGTALHPLNVPEIDKKRGVVTDGFAIYEPRISVSLGSSNRSDFSRIFFGDGGVDPYGGAVSSVYQDVCGEGTFMGKGLINVPVYRRLLDSGIPDNLVLSHDIIEGAYLRCAFVSDIEFTDGCPYKVTSYFTRLERWTRGDWQNIRWLAGRLKRPDGAYAPNRIGALNKWKLLDNLRRSLVPVMASVAVILGLLLPIEKLLYAGVIAAAALISPILITCGEMFFVHDGAARVRYKSPALNVLAAGILRNAVMLMLLPVTAWISLTAMVTAVYRMTISRRKLLQWVTSAQSDGQSLTLGGYYKFLGACPIAGLVIALLTPYPPAIAVGIAWLSAPAFALAMSRRGDGQSYISETDRGYLKSCAEDIWGFFRDNLNEENNWLVPDNVQPEPLRETAHRTSPTNIGLSILAAAAASDLGAISDDSAPELIGKILGSVEKLEKWNGHLYNWYDTVTLRPLEPRYVSTVDSGNLVGALIAAKGYFNERGLHSLASRCERLIQAPDFSVLYDAKRALFHIGFDIKSGTLSDGRYDLLESEARQTSFIATALGQVPRKHWRKLGRALVTQDNYSGCVSWTGTMFEYLMPNLLLPCPKSSLLYESTMFALYVQKRRGKRERVPWGVSESAYYAFDPGLSYRYKAHGAQKLALKRGMDIESVVSPYSTFLALPFDTGGAAGNLRKLEKYGMIGKYGHYEALDFTPSRVGSGRSEPVRTFMAHHLGMSIVAIANALCGDVFPRRFMSDVRMRAYSELLEERLPRGVVTLRNAPRTVPEKPMRHESFGCREQFDAIDVTAPRAIPLSNGAYTLIAAESGRTLNLAHDIETVRNLYFYVRTRDGVFPITAEPERRRDAAYSAELNDVACIYRARYGNAAAEVSVSVPDGDNGLSAKVSVTGLNDGEGAEIICAFTPVIARTDEYDAHPAFSRLSLECEASDNILYVKRRSEKPIYLAAMSDGSAGFVTERGRGDAPDGGRFVGTSPDISIRVKVPVVSEGGKCGAAFAIAVAASRDECGTAVKRILERGESKSISRVTAAALMLDLDTSNAAEAFSYCTKLLFAATVRTSGAGAPREKLWKFGISGDVPIIAARIESDSDLEAAGRLLRRHALLRENGVRCDLALLISDVGEYISAQRDGLNAVMRKYHLDGRGGVYIIDAHDADAEAVLSAARINYDLGSPYAPPARNTEMPPENRERVYKSGGLSYRTEPDGTFRCAMAGSLPPVSWGNILTNGSFGFLATDAGTGYMWYKNSRMFKMNRWLNDPLTVRGTETLYLADGGSRESLFCDGGELPAMLEYGFGYAKWQKELPNGAKSSVTAFVPDDVPARILIISLEGAGEDAVIEYSTDLVLGEADGGALRTFRDGDALCAVNLCGEYRGDVFRLIASAEPLGYTMSRESRDRGEYDGATGTMIGACAAVRCAAGRGLVIVTGCGEADALRRLADRDNAADALKKAVSSWTEKATAVTIKTRHEELDKFINGWAAYQTLACRICARTSLYQNGGAVGFRDQLQDACAMILTDSSIAFERIKEAASHQYAEGDVQHWWHDRRGVRTRCGDDLMWLPWALCEYVGETGDMSICGIEVPWLLSETLSDDERDRYETADVSGSSSAIFEHACRAADLFIRRGTGEHGLSLILGGDWNDGMDKVGTRGKGESVWLTWFGAIVLERLSKLCVRMDEFDRSARYDMASRELVRAAEATFTGKWYPRGWHDDGTAIGVPDSGECEIDSISQSFAVFAGADRQRCKKALGLALRRLEDRERRIVKLFAPPFTDGKCDPGYIRSYAPGYRENGGQYTHAAVWLAIALLRSGEYESGLRVLKELSPYGRDTDIYKAEPYVIAADVYSAAGHEGRGGWSWYTGSAGWYYRAVVEELLGVKLVDGELRVEPKLPESFGACRVSIRRNGETVDIDIDDNGNVNIRGGDRCPASSGGERSL